MRTHDRIIRYIEARNPDAARKVGRRILDAGNALGKHPTGWRGRAAGTYVKSVTDVAYLIVYRIDRRRDRIDILDIVHARQDGMPGLTS
jgi:toxin ParE1/3/4